MNKNCDNHCSASTGIHESTIGDGSPEHPYGLTFGSGVLDEYGYWENPCPTCARLAEKIHEVPVNTYWPYERE